ncbi:polymorphic toxin-type HINT domain-containing protein [Streptomyces sp. NBC_00183]|uniref:polymorphic toxin-type HINT domain-containing protein n=2 Tax=unclassified Streptomyces TaxID=2593676 RepID=UPI00225616E0|nr:polymorphic toxin-type HINT domain-containing protein [Streptomyces sp. NBC_00183]MCX5294159.1 polymorphic toxin-type HINT domain-containing protein [Streptomyces sp. NBC_00183]
MGALVLALAAGTVSADAMPPHPDPSRATASPQAAPSRLPQQKAEPAADTDSAAAEPTTDNAVYAYDAVGRLVGVSDPGGETARYRYDKAGNRLGIDRYASSTLSVLSVVPVRAKAGAKVTLAGTGFSPTAASNAVTFGGKAATVTSASATRLVVIVPSAAVSGKVAVTVSGKSVEATESFTVAPSGPTISKIEPASGVSGAQVVLTGTGFAAAATDNVVRFNGIVAEVKERTSTSLTVEVPPNARTGRVELATPDGSATAPSDFSVTADASESLFDTTMRASVTDTDPSQVSVVAAGHKARILFDADRGDAIGFGLQGATFSALADISLVSPQGTTLGASNFSSTSADWEAFNLPETGTYQFVIDPRSSTDTGSVAVFLSKPVGEAVAFDGPTVTTGLSRMGQDGAWAFTAAKGESLSVGVDATAMSSYTRCYVYLPDGTQGDYLPVPNGDSNSLDIDSLTQAGQYTLRCDPDSGGTGTVKVAISHYVQGGTLDPTAPSTTLDLARPGQEGVASFTAQAGDHVSLGATGTTIPSYAVIEIHGPGGSYLTSLTSAPGRDADWDSDALAAAGTYTVRITGRKLDTGKVTLTLSKPSEAGVMTVGGAAVKARATRPGQDIRATFSAQAGDDLSLELAANTFTKSVSVTVVAPSGTKVVSGRLVYAGASGTIALTDVAESGTYRVEISPSSLATGTVDLTLKAATAAATAKAVTAEVPHPSLRTACLVEELARGFIVPRPDWLQVRADRCEALKRQAAAKEAKAKKAAGIVPKGADAWHPGAANLKGRDWLTHRKPAPKAPARLRAPPGSTAMTGHVLKLDGKPLAQVTVRVGKKSTRTDTQGRFVLAGISAAAKTLTVDGASANTAQRTYGRYDIRIHPVAGHSPDLGFPVWMSPLDTKHTVTFDAPAKSDVTLTTPDIPGLEVRLPKGSVVRDEHGKTVTELGITAIPVDRSPFPLPKNSVVPIFFTVQPGGSYVFPDGAQIIYPNYTDEAPGARVDFLAYDPAGKGWHTYGHGTVSRDGKQVVPDKKTMVWAFTGAMISVSDAIPFDISAIGDVFDWLSGDPVNLQTGLLTDSRTDLGVADPLGSAEVTRSYWQGDSRSRAFGIGRHLSYNMYLHSKHLYTEVDLYLPGGKKVHFVRTSAGTSYGDAVFEPEGTPTALDGSKIQQESGGWHLRLRDGSDYLFPWYGPLQEIRDRHGNTIRLTRSNGTKGDITTITSPGGRWISLAYDSQHRVTGARDNTGRTTSYIYDDAGRLKTVTDPAGKTSSYTYDGTSNRIKTATDARGIVYMTNDYDTDNRVKHQTLTEGQEYSFAYSTTSTNQVTATQVTEPGGAVRRVEFDAAGFGAAETDAYGTSLARKTVYERGTNHRVSAIVDPYGRRTELSYDTHGHATSALELAGTADALSTGTTTFDGPYDQPSASSDPLGHSTVFTYGAGGDLQTSTDPEGRKTTFSFEADGQIKTVTDNANAVTEYTYTHGNLASVKDSEGRTSRQFTDAAGRVTALMDEAGSLTTVSYDKLSQSREITDPLGNTTALDYDPNGNLTTLTDARNNTTTWAYDDADRPKTATDPLGAQALFAYDAAGHLKQATNRSGQAATAEYDLLGRLKTTQYGVNAVGQAESTATYDYYDNDLLKQITDSQAGTQSFGYDVHDRLSSVTGPTGNVTYEYDDASRRATMTAAGTSTTYGWDKSSILTSVTSGSQKVTFGLDAVGREKTASLPGGITRTTGYDTTGVIKSIAYAQGSKTIGDLTYTRDGRALQTGLTGSLAKVALPAAETGTQFGKDNRITSYDGRTFTYDDDGQLKNDGLRTYTWNARGDLTGLAKQGTASTFGYDPLGGRVSKTIGGSTSRFLTDGSNPLVEQDSSKATTATVATSGLDEYLTRSEGGTTQVYLTDALGSVVGLANTDGTVATTYAYDPNGTPTASGTASTNPYTFTGRENDGTGLLYYRDRYYDPQTSQFISQDPSGQAGSTNLYQYALSSPTTYTDPSGNNPMIAACVVGGLMDGGLDWLTQRLSGRKVNWGQVGQSAAIGCLSGMLGEGLGALAEGKAASRAASCARPNSFTGDTPVLMSDGTRKPIKDVAVGDTVIATDPETGDTGPRKVTALIKGDGDKQLVDITLDTDGLAGTRTDTITATDGHPFWVPQLHQWVDAGALKAGQWLQTSTGTWVQITAIRHRTQPASVYNLTVDDLHTYYVLAGTTSLLVHNAGCGVGPSAVNPDYTTGAIRNPDGTWTIPEDSPLYRPPGENRVGQGRFEGRIEIDEKGPKTRTGEATEAFARFIDKLPDIHLPGHLPGS